MDISAHGMTKMVARFKSRNDTHWIELEIYYTDYLEIYHTDYSPHQEHTSTFNLFFENNDIARAYAADINSVETETAKEVA